MLMRIYWRIPSFMLMECKFMCKIYTRAKLPIGVDHIGDVIHPIEQTFKWWKNDLSGGYAWAAFHRRRRFLMIHITI